MTLGARVRRNQCGKGGGVRCVGPAAHAQNKGRAVNRNRRASVLANTPRHTTCTDFFAGNLSG